jgi:hypothetical protein
MSTLLTFGTGTQRHEIDELATVREIAELGTITLYADAAHPNKLSFRGILTRLDEPSTKAPQGAMNHRILMTSEVAQDKIGTLIGMGVNYHQNLDAHDPTYKVGVIDKAWIKGSALWISGFVWIGDFPDAEKVLSQKDMGMSMELTHVLVKDRTAPVWELSDFYFTGATFLRKSKAAYFDTTAIAAAADDSTTIYILNTEADMPVNKDEQTTDVLTPEQQELATVAASAAAATITKALGPMLASIGTAMTVSNATSQAILAKLNAEEDEDDVAAATPKVKVGKVKADKDKDKDKDKDDFDDDDDDTDDDGDDDGDDDDDDDDDDDSDLDGGLGKNEGPGGNGTKKSPLVGMNTKVPKWKGRAKKLKAANKALKADLAAAKDENSRLRAAKGATEGSTARVNASEATRLTLSAPAIQLLAKNGMDVVDLKASGQKLSADEVDACLANVSHPLSAEQRIELKMELKAAGIMQDKAAEPVPTRRSR